MTAPMGSVTKIYGGATLCCLLSACAPTPEILEPIEAPKLGRLDAAYDRTKWRWVRNLDGRPLLTHTDVQKCFVDLQPPFDVHEPGLSIKRSEKTIGGARYEIVSVFEKDEFWEAVYVQSQSSTPILSVYARGRCQDEAERIVERYERPGPAGPKSVPSAGRKTDKPQ